MEPSEHTLDISPRRQFVRKIAFDRRGRPYGKVRTGWREQNGGISYRSSVVFFPHDFDEFLAGLEKFTKILDSSGSAVAASGPTTPVVGTSGPRFCFHFPPRPGKRAAVVATFRVSPSGKPLQTVQFYVFVNEGQRVLAFLKDLRNDLGKIETGDRLASETRIKAEPPTPAPPKPQSPAPSVHHPTPTTHLPLDREEIASDVYDFTEFDVDLLERFNDSRWQGLVEEKCDLERQLFMDSLDENERFIKLERLQGVLGEMNDICAIKEREEIAREGEDDECY